MSLNIEIAILCTVCGKLTDQSWENHNDRTTLIVYCDVCNPELHARLVSKGWVVHTGEGAKEVIIDV